METLKKAQLNRSKCDTNSAILPVSRTFSSTMAEPSSNSSSSSGNGRRGLSPTELMTEKLEAAVSSDVKRRIDTIVGDVNKFSDLEKLLLYLKLPTSSINGMDSHHLKSTSPSLTVTRIEQTQAFNWIHSHLEECSDTSLPKHEVYEDYRLYCESANRRVLSQADFGKIMKNVFPQVKPRRLGTRGNAKYCYSGLRKKSDIQPPSLPSMDSPRKIGPNDFSRSSSLCKCGEEQHQLDLANTAVICEWADKIFGLTFQTTDEIAHHLASNKLVSNSVASFTVLSTGGKDSSLGMVKLPSTPEERRKETNNQLQRTIHQRQLSKLKEQQANEKNNHLKSTDSSKPDKQWEERKGLSRSHSVPNEIQMNARIDSQMGSSKCEESLNGSRLTNRPSDQQRNPTQSNNNSNNSNQTAAGSTAIALTTTTTVKESPNKRRFTPIQPKTPVRDSTVKIPVNNRQVVLVPNSAIVNAKGQKIQQFPPGVQLFKVAGLGGSSQQVATVPMQNIPNSKPVAFGSAKSNGSLPGTTNGQNIMVLPRQAFKGSPVAGSMLVVKQSPSASLATNLVSASISGSTATTGRQDLLRTSASQTNSQNVMLQLQSDAGGPTPQGGTSSSHSGIVPLVTSLSPLSNVRGELSYLPTKSPSCPSSSTVLLRPVSVDPQTAAPNTSNLSVAFNSQATDLATVQLAQNQSTEVTFATLSMRKEVSEGPSAVLLAGHQESNTVPPDGRLQSCTSSSNTQIPVNVANSASALLAIFSNSANREQSQEESRSVKRSPHKMISQMGGSVGAVQAVSLSSNGIEKSQASVVNQHSKSSTVYLSQGVGTTPQDMAQRSCLAIPPSTSFELKSGAQGLQYTAVTSLTVPNKFQACSQPITTSSLMSMLKAPVLETTQINHQQMSDLGQNREGGNLASLTHESVPVFSVPIHTSDQPLMSQGSIEMPIAFEVGNKRFALAPSNQVVQTSSSVPFQILSQINELPTETVDAVNVNTEVNQEMEILGSRFQGTRAVLSGSLGVAFGQSTSVSNPQQQVEIDVQGRQSITPSFNPHSNTSTPIPPGMESVPLSPTDPSQVFFKFTPIQQSVEQPGPSVTSPSPVKPMQKPKPTHLSTSQGSFATPSRKRRSSGTIRRPNFNSTISVPPAVSRQITPTPSPSGSRCSTPLSPSMLSANSQADMASMPPPSPVMIPSDLNQPTTSRGSINRELSSQTLGQVTWGTNVHGNRKRNPSGPPTLMQPAKQLSLDAASFLPEDLNDLNIQTYDSSFDLGRAQQQYQRSHSVPLPAYQPVVLSQDRFLPNFPTSVDQRGITVNNRSFGAKRNLTQELQVIQVTDEDFNPEENFLGGSNDTAFNDLLGADLQQPTEGQGPWAGDSALTGIQSDSDLNVDFPISSCSSEQVTENQLSLAQSLTENSNSTTSTLNEEIAAMDDMGSNPVFRDITLPSWSQIGSTSNLTTLECGM